MENTNNVNYAIFQEQKNFSKILDFLNHYSGQRYDSDNIEISTHGKLAYEYAKKSRWDKIFCVVPHGTFVDDHSRFMAHSGMKERQELFEILKQSLIDVGYWDKVVILDGDYYQNFMTVVKYVREVIENGKN